MNQLILIWVKFIDLKMREKIPVVLIETQVGEYTGEDDIVRIEDDFKRGLIETQYFISF